MSINTRGFLSILASLALVTGCGDTGGGGAASASVESCMQCHNGSQKNNYAGPGMENPHPFVGADNLRCTACHGGNPDGADKDESHVPAPPEIGDRQNWITNRHAFFNRLTLTGIDKFPDYQVLGQTYTALEYLQFINPGDLRVVTRNLACGQCHGNHATVVASGPLATETGVFSGAMYTIGEENHIPLNQGMYEDTAADMGFRDVQDTNYDPSVFGSVTNLIEFPVFSVRNANGPLDIHNNPIYDAVNLVGDLNADNSVISGSPLANLFHEQVAFTCGDCHLGSAGANNRYGDFRSSGCTACHMRYSLSGRSTSGDPNLNRLEPYDPDDLDEPELPHVKRHLITSTAQTLTTGETVMGIDDYTCAGCHQGSNRTVMQYWGIRLDQNANVVQNRQYPANPASRRTTSGDTRLFDPTLEIYDPNGNFVRLGNNEFNGRNRNQYLLEEDYDGDNRDDTPPDVHYEAGMGCIDCHGSFDLHGGDTSMRDGRIVSRMEHAVAIGCEDCHGGIDAYASTTTGIAYDGSTAELAVDGEGNPINHVLKEADGNYYLYSKLTGNRHFLPQTKDTTVNSGKNHPFTGTPIYTDQASYAMGRMDGNQGTGHGPRQMTSPLNGFSHTDNMSCVSCHAAWTNSCIGCHLEGEYNTGNNFSNITGDRIVFREREAEFVYQSPVPFQLGVNTDNKIAPIAANTDSFFKWRDRNGQFSQVFAFTDRNGGGNNPLRASDPSLSHNVMMPHSIRGRVSSSYEGPRYCVSCHLTTEGMTNFGTEYNNFRTAMANDNFGSLNYNLLQNHIGRNTGNQMNSPIWVHMVAGLGTGLFLFDKDGCAVNPLDNDPNRYGCNGVAPASVPFDPSRVEFNLDRIVDDTGASTGSNAHPMRNPGQGPNLRDGALNPNLSGPLGATLIRRLADPTTGIVLDSWVDADGQPQGGAGVYIP